MQKKYIITSIIIIIIIICINLSNPTSIKYYKNYNLLIPEPKQTKIIFQEEDNIDNKYNNFLILNFTEKKFHKIIKNNNAKQIKNTNELKKIIQKEIVPHLYDNTATKKLNHRLWLYEEYFSYDLINNNNYYLYFKEHNKTCIMIFDTTKETVYIFENNYN